MYNQSILLVDDNVLFVSRLEKDLIELGFDQVFAFSEVGEAIKFASDHTFDVAILDINLSNVLSGIDLAKNILKANHHCIFITSYAERSIYEAAQHLEATTAFIVKPFDKLTLLSFLESFAQDKQKKLSEEAIDSNDPIFYTQGNDYFFLKSDFTINRIAFEELLCFEVDGNYTVIVTKDKKYAVKLSLRKIMKLFDRAELVQVHRNYTIYFPKINKINLKMNQVLIGEGNYQVPLSNTYKKQVIERLRNL